MALLERKKYEEAMSDEHTEDSQKEEEANAKMKLPYQK